MKKGSAVLHIGNRVFISIFVLVFTSASLWAADVVAPTWSVPSVDNQIRNLTENYNGAKAVLGAGSRFGNVSNSTLTINGLTVDTESDLQGAYANGTGYVVGGAVYDKTASSNRANITGSSTIQGRTVFGGAAFLDNLDNRFGTGTASNNVVSIVDSAVQKSSSFIPTGETSSTQIGGDVIGGYSDFTNGHADNNTVILNNSTVEGDVYGGKVVDHLIPDVDYDLETGELRDHVTLNYTTDGNMVQVVNGSIVNGVIYGAAGAEGANRNTILIDSSAALGGVYGAYNGMVYYKGSDSSAITSFNENTIIIRNGSLVSTVLAVGGYSANAYDNILDIDNSTVAAGSLHTVIMDLALKDTTPINAEIRGNMLSLSNAGTLSLDEIGAGLNYAGTANMHRTQINNVANLTVNRPTDMFGILDWNTLSTNNLIGLKDSTAAVANVDKLNAAYGVIYGGASLDYVTQAEGVPTTFDYMDADDTGIYYVIGSLRIKALTAAPEEAILANGGNDGGQSDNNVVYIKDSTVKSNIMGGFAGQIKEVNYTTWAYTPAVPPSGSDPGTPANFTKTEVIKDGDSTITKVYQCGPNGITCDGGTVTGDPVKEDGYQEKVFSASNNAVVLDNSHITGTVYGGFVTGADLRADNAVTSNNTVVIRGNTTLDNTAVLYGGNSILGQTTNTLVFDYVNNGAGGFVTYNSKDQFKNFNDVWQINADYDTRINFDFEGVNAAVNLDPTLAGEGSAVIIKTKTATDLSNVEQNGVVTDLIDTSVELTRKRVGIYSYDLVGVKEGTSVVGWNLNGKKDSSNVEIYGQLPLVGLALAAEGPEMLSRTFVEAWRSDSESNAFLNGGYHDMRYETGSGFDLRSGIVQAGLWKKYTSNWMGGFFVKYSGGSYKTYPIKATGEAKTYGAGLMTSLYLTETTRLEGEVEIGYMNLEFESDELLSKLKSKGMYYGAMGGIVQNLTEKWDIFANLHFLRKDKDDMTDSLGQKITYEGMQTISLKAGTNWELDQNWGGLIPSLGVMAIYEMAGKSKVNVQDASNNEASLKGLSGRGQLNLSYENQSTFLPMVSQLTVFGQVGKRRGFGGEINVSFLF